MILVCSKCHYFIGIGSAVSGLSVKRVNGRLKKCEALVCRQCARKVATAPQSVKPRDVAGQITMGDYCRQLYAMS